MLGLSLALSHEVETTSLFLVVPVLCFSHSLSWLLFVTLFVPEEELSISLLPETSHNSNAHLEISCQKGLVLQMTS